MRFICICKYENIFFDLPGDEVTGSKFDPRDDLRRLLPEMLDLAGVVAASGELIAPKGEFTLGDVGWSYKSE